MSMEDFLISPHSRSDQIGRESIEAEVCALMEEGALNHGWIVGGANGAGKATLAYRIARGVLAPADLKSPQTFDISTESQAFKLIAAGAHPDLFVAERSWNEKTSKYQTEITVETIRRLISFLNRTPAFGGYRVAIIDIADDLNRNAANALLKVLEEPPAKTLLLLLAEAPGRLIATIRSRCRRIDLRPVPDEKIMRWLVDINAVLEDDAAVIAQYARGRPGYALRVATSDGASAISLANMFLNAAMGNTDLGKITQALSGKQSDEKWGIFQNVILETLSDTARKLAQGIAPPFDFKTENPATVLSAWEAILALISRGDALNIDRSQLIDAMAHDLRAEISES